MEAKGSRITLPGNQATMGPGLHFVSPDPVVPGFPGALKKRQRLPPSDPRISRPDATADSRPRGTAGLEPGAGAGVLCVHPAVPQSSSRRAVALTCAYPVKARAMDDGRQ